MVADREIASYFDSLSEQLNKHELDLRAALSEFYSVLIVHLETAQEEHQRLNLERASDFNTFTFFRTDENTLSRIMADFLTPSGSHGQGKVFLDRFLDRIGHPGLAAQSAGAKVRYQDPASWGPDGGILDITVDFGNFGIGIENKPSACEQPNQLARYVQHLRGRYSGRFCLVYVSGSSNPPRSIPAAERLNLENEGRFRTLSYASDLRCWLRECRDKARAAKVRWFIDEFIAYLLNRPEAEEGNHESR